MSASHDRPSGFDDTRAPSGLWVDPADEHELAFWTSVWNVSAEELRQAVRYVGPDSASVGLYLGLQLHGARTRHPH